MMMKNFNTYSAQFVVIWAGIFWASVLEAYSD